jgi:hypothetical protein
VQAEGRKSSRFGIQTSAVAKAAMRLLASGECGVQYRESHVFRVYDRSVRPVLE